MPRGIVDQNTIVQGANILVELKKKNTLLLAAHHHHNTQSALLHCANGKGSDWAISEHVFHLVLKGYLSRNFSPLPPDSACNGKESFRSGYFERISRYRSFPCIISPRALTNSYTW